jgi:lipopolysaccharide export system permease protein
VGKGLPWSVIAEVFALSIPFIVAMTLPMAVLTAVLYTFTHLAADNEVTAIRASGISIPQLVAPVLLTGFLVAGVNFAFTDQVLPRSNTRLRSLLLDIGRKKPTFELREQVINDLGQEGVSIRATRIDPASGRMRGVTLYDLGSQTGRRIIYADSGRMAMTADGTDLSLRLFDGTVHEFKIAEPGVFQMTDFRENEIRVRNVTNMLERNTADAVRGDREMGTCEMLDVIRNEQRDVRQARMDRRYMTHRDLRNLLSLPTPPAPPPVTVRPSRGYCAVLPEALRTLTPRTAEAQQATQDTGRRRLLGRPPKEGPPPVRDSIRPAAGEAPAGPSVTARPPYAVSPTAVPVTGWAEVANAVERGRAAAKEADRFAVEVHKKWSISVACIVFVLVGIPMALRFPRGGMGLVIGGGLGVFSIYYIALIGGEALGDRDIISPALGMWAPNVIFFLLGLYGMYRVNRESGSTRGGDLGELWDKLVGRWKRI